MKVLIPCLKLYHEIEMKILEVELFPWSFWCIFNGVKPPFPSSSSPRPVMLQMVLWAVAPLNFPFPTKKTSGISRPTSRVMEWTTSHGAVSRTLGAPLSWPTQLNEDFHWLWSLQWAAVVVVEPWGSSSKFGAALTFGLCLLHLLDTPLLGLDSYTP